jgi:hypothetical protein
MPKYSYSTNEENFFGHYDSREEAAAEGFCVEPDADVLWVGENVQQTAHEYVRVEYILEGIVDAACDDCGLSAEDWLCELTEPQIKQLKTVIGDWLETICPVNFYTAVNVERIEREG